MFLSHQTKWWCRQALNLDGWYKSTQTFQTMFWIVSRVFIIWNTSTLQYLVKCNILILKFTTIPSIPEQVFSFLFTRLFLNFLKSLFHSSHINTCMYTYMHNYSHTTPSAHTQTHTHTYINILLFQLVIRRHILLVYGQRRHKSCSFR